MAKKKVQSVDDKSQSQQKQPIRCFDGNAKPYEPFWTFRNATDSGEAELELYGVISEYSWMDDDITPKKFKDDLYSIGKGGPVTMKINSPGGDVIAASVIRSIISEYPGAVTAQVTGMAASAAVVVAMAAKNVKMMDTAYMMIHDPAVVVFLAVLDIETLSRLHDNLKSIKSGIVDTYAAKTGLSNDKISRMMADETWMSAHEAVNYGFANEVIDGGQSNKPNSSQNHAFVNALQNFINVPPAVLSALQAVEPSETPAEEIPATDGDAEEQVEKRERLERLRERVNQLKENKR